jgi:hypothetical protein
LPLQRKFCEVRWTHKPEKEFRKGKAASTVNDWL